MEKAETKQNEQQSVLLEPIVKATDTKEYLLSTVGQEIKQFELMQRQAMVYSSSTIVPKQYQGKENIGNVIIGLDMAKRMGVNPLMVFQNLYVVYGNPAWSSKFLIATFNMCGRFTPIQYIEIGKKNTDEWGMKAITTSKETGEKIEGPAITIGLAKKEGWYSKSGSKWQTMPEMMLRYRSAAWLINTVAPEISMGISTQEEIDDANVQDVEFEELTSTQVKKVTSDTPETQEKKSEIVSNIEKQEEEKEEDKPTAASLFGNKK